MYRPGRLFRSTMKILREWCSTVNVYNFYFKGGSTAFHWAARCGQLQVVQIFLKTGAHLNREDGTSESMDFFSPTVVLSNKKQAKNG